MGSGLCPGFSDTLLQPAKPGTPAKSSYILRRAKLSYSSRGQHTTRERGNHLGEKPFRPQEFLFNSVPCSQERRSDETSNQPLEAERLGGTPTFQNGRYGDTQGTTERERVDGEGGPQRCILHNTNTHRPPTLPEVHGGTGTLSVHLPPIRSVVCPMGIHQSDEAHCNLPTCQRGENDRLYRRYSADGRHSGTGKESSGSVDFPADRTGVCHQCAKSITTPTQQIEFQGLKVNSVSLHLSLPGEKLHHIRMEVRQHLQRSQLTARQLAQLIGKLHAASQAVLPAPLFYRSLQGDLHRVLNLTNQNYDALVSLSAQALEELTWWQEKLTQWNGKALLCRPQTITITSDASIQGWGAVCNGTRTGGPWRQSEQGMHINCLELLAATLAAKTFLKGQIGQSVLLQLDNQTGVAYINNMGGTVSPQLTDLAKALWRWALSNDIALIVEYIPGVVNVVADAESRSMMDRADWKLHPRLFQGINQKWGPLEVDLFASRLSTQLPRYFSWKPDPLAEATDAFTQQWEKFRGYANPHGA